MKRKIIKQKFLENKDLLAQKSITHEEYFDIQFELLKDVRNEIDKLDRLNFGIFKIIKSWFYDIIKSKN